ncbi:hypothetical protein FQA47_018884 [Oryzias melastigma]|uniref:Uncharacterized protein n=1 Tax=Oryzias melastigma TaxID=30732 RepID=A0A834CRM8_ORYME|nr:hypothetical protein FQA47_018884 [Oryzias melastigma]
MALEKVHTGASSHPSFRITRFSDLQLVNALSHLFLLSQNKDTKSDESKTSPSYKKERKMSLIQKQHLLKRFLHPRDEMSDSATDPLHAVAGDAEQNVASRAAGS